MSSISSSSRSPSPEPVELPTQLSELCDLTAKKPESLVHGDNEIQAAALRAAKFLFDRGVLSEVDAAPAMDELLRSIDVPQAPVTRSQVAKQKAAGAPPPKESLTFDLTPLDSLILDGMGADQIWAQLELRAKNICKVLDSIIDREPDDDEAEGEEVEGEHMDVDGDPGPSGLNGASRRFGLDDEEESEEEDSDEDSDESDMGEDIVKLRDHAEEERPPVVGHSRQRPRSQQPVWSGPRHPTLDDGFFSIDKFNRNTELMEAKSKSGGRLGGDEDDSEEEEEIDLFAPIDEDEEEEMDVDEEDEDEDEEEESDDEEDEEDEEGIPSKQSMLNGAFKTEGMDDVMYNDFFRPPYKFADSATTSKPSSGPKAASASPKGKGKAKAKGLVRFAEDVRVKTIRARGKGRSLNDDDDDEYDDLMGMNGAGGAFMNPFMNMTGPGGFGGFAPRQLTGPGGFGGFAPRQPVVAPTEGEGNQNGPTLNGSDPFAGIDGADREDSDEEDYEEEDHEDEMEDEDDDEEGEDEDEEDDDGEGDYDMDEGQEAIERLKNDIFAEPEEDYRPPEELSTHEKRQRAIAQEIAILEDQNVAEKSWTLMGEANAKRRPENSLLETDLEFEAAAKQAPIITEEVTKSLEDLIKARILENRFDDVIRQRPVDDKAFLPSKVLEISDKEAQKGLAEIYEDEYTAAASGEGRKDDRLMQEHKDIEKTWGDISYKLDALSNAHFTPKQPKATISTLSNVASTSLESALPTSMSTSTLLAPEETFAFDPRAATSKTEMSPGEKKALRAKVKHERKAQGQAINGAVVKFSNNAGGSATAAAGLKNGKHPRNVREAKDAALDSLVKTGKGVTVVGKPHVGKSVNGKDKAREGGASFKL